MRRTNEPSVASDRVYRAGRCGIRLALWPSSGVGHFYESPRGPAGACRQHYLAVYLGGLAVDAAEHRDRWRCRALPPRVGWAAVSGGVGSRALVVATCSSGPTALRALACSEGRLRAAGIRCAFSFRWIERRSAYLRNAIVSRRHVLPQDGRPSAVTAFRHLLDAWFLSSHGYWSATVQAACSCMLPSHSCISPRSSWPARRPWFEDNVQRTGAFLAGLIAASLALSGPGLDMVSPQPREAAPFLRPHRRRRDDLQGRPCSLGSMRGAPLVVIFFASWCGPCHEDAPIYTDLADRFRHRVSFISVAVDDPPHEVRGFAKRYDWTWPVVRDDGQRWVAAFGPLGVPATYVIDSDGVVIRTLAGAVTRKDRASLDPLVLPTVSRPAE